MKASLKFLLILFTLLFPLFLAAQFNVAINILQQPCDADGIATVSINGGIPPYTISWEQNNQYFQVDTFQNFQGGYIQVHVADLVGDFADAGTQVGVIQRNNFSTLPDTCS